MATRPEVLPEASPQSRWLASEMFRSGIENEYIKSFIHRDYAFGMHTHDFWELNIVLRGEGVHYLGDNVLDIRTGDVFAVPPDVRHGYHNAGGLDVYHMLIRREFFPKYMGELSRWAGYSYLFQVEPFLRNVTDKSLFLRLSPPDMASIRDDISLIEVYANTDSAVKECLISSVAVKMLHHLCYCMSKQLEIDSNGDPGDSYAVVYGCLNHIHINYSRKITIEDLAQLCHVSRATLFRCFSSVCKCSPGQYIARYRLERAEELIQSGGKSLTEIAAECGYYDYSHLKRQLKP